jgi:putative GTP pyrophosphokinase
MDSALADEYKKRFPTLQKLAQALESEVLDLLRGVPHVDRVYFRAKEPCSFAKKAASGDYEYPMVEIEDQVAGRVLVFFLDDVSAIVSRIRANFATVEARKRTPEKHDVFGYESYHCIFTIPPKVKPVDWGTLVDPPVTFELQVRTLFQHAWAEPQHDVGYKGAPDAPRDGLRELAWAASSAWGADRGFQRAMALLKGAKDD